MLYFDQTFQALASFKVIKFSKSLKEDGDQQQNFSIF
jgi:hypothetical protein